MVFRHPFLAKTKDCLGKEIANGQADDGTDERYKEVGAMRVVYYKICEIVVHLDTILSPNSAEEYPRPHKHEGDT